MFLQAMLSKQKSHRYVTLHNPPFSEWESPLGGGRVGGMAGQLAGTAPNNRDDPYVIEGQSVAAGSLAGGPDLQVMSPRVSAGGPPPVTALGNGSAQPPPSIFPCSSRHGGSAEKFGERDYGESGSGIAAASTSSSRNRAGREAEQHQQQTADAGAGADFSSLLSSHVPQDQKGMIPCASRKAECLFSLPLPKL